MQHNLSSQLNVNLPDRDSVDRRGFLKSVTTAVTAATVGGLASYPRQNQCCPQPKKHGRDCRESAVRHAHRRRKRPSASTWDHKHPQRGLLARTCRISGTSPSRLLNSHFFTKDQKA